MKLNVAKCKVMTFHRIRNPIIATYTINNKSLDRVTDSMKDLGVVFQPNLKFNQHIDTTKNKAMKILGFINRNSKDFENPQTFITLYKSLVRPILEYSSNVWNTHYANQISKLESVQRKFFRIVAYRDHSRIINHDYRDIHRKHHFCTFEERRKIMDAIFLFKLLNSLVECPDLLHQIDFRLNNCNTRNNDLFKIRRTRCNESANSILNRVMKVGNQISKDTDIDFFANSLAEVKTRLSNH
ncbi:hypothetical protein WDU94_012206 [Cyamophila willieti]